MTGREKAGRIRLFLILIGICTLLTCCRKQDAQTENEPVKVKIGILLDFTGEKAAESEQMYKAASLAVDEINEAGGVLTEGLQVELIKKDDGGNYMNSVAGYYQLAEEGVCAVIGTNNAKGMEEIINASANANIPIITPSVTDDFVVDASNFLYQSCFSDEYMTEALVEFASDEFEFYKLAVIYSAQDERKISLYEDFAAAALRKKLELTYAKEMPDYDAESVKEAVRALMDAGTQLVFVAGDPDGFGEVLKQAEAEGYEGVFLGTDGCMEDSDTTYGYDVYVPCNMAVERQSGEIDDFVDKFGDTITCDGVRPAYDAVYFIRDAIEEGYLATPASIALKLPFLEGSTRFGEYVIGAYGNTEKSVDILRVTDDNRTYAGTIFE